MNYKASITAHIRTAMLIVTAAAAVAIISAMAGIRTASAEADITTQRYVDVETLPAIIYKQTYYDIPLSIDFQQYVTLICDAHDVDPVLAYAVMRQESNYDATAVNASEDCYGLMQIHKCNFTRYGLDEPLDAYANANAGITILGELIAKYGDVHKVLMVYNCGESRASELWRQGVTSTSYSRDVVEKVAEINEKGRECVEVP